MEHKQFISNALKLSPPANLSFQADKFMRKNNCLSIPDTIHEQAEISGDSTKMEASGDLTKILNCDEKENINNSQQVISNESSDSSKIISIDNSFIKKCEKKLLESSSSDEEKIVEYGNKSAVNKQVLEIPRLALGNDSVSTPPSALRKEISLLRNELAATEEFHDFEILLLKEEKAHNEVELQDYLQVVEKNAALIELYTSLKNEYDEYRKQQEKMRDELQSKTADCLESLCSQIEASDSSLNFSSASFISFNAGIKSSTMMEDNSEVEATVMHDATVLTSDPLSITLEGAFKTPMQTPLRSAKKLFPQQVNWSSKITDVKEVKEIIDKRQSIMSLDSKRETQLLNLEKALNDKLIEVEGLEQRLFKMEDTCNSLRGDCERTTEILSKKTEQLSELTQKLFTEIISLNPALRESLIDASGPRLLVILIETIMEKCKNVQDELIQKHICEKMEWDAQRKTELAAIESLENQVKSLNDQLSLSQSRFADLEDSKLDLEKKLKNAENELLMREVEMRILQTSVREAREDFTSSAEALLKLQSQLSSAQNEKKQMEDRYQELEETVRCLKNELEEKEKLSVEVETMKSALAYARKRSENLKQIIKKSDKIVDEVKTESLEGQEELLQEIEWLKNQDASRFNRQYQQLECLKEKMANCPEQTSDKNSALPLASDNLRECSDRLLLFTMEDLFEWTLENQIEVANKKNDEFKSMLSKIVAEKNELRNLCEDLKKQLHDAGSVISLRDEEVLRWKREEEVLKKLKEDLDLLEDGEDSEFLADRIGKLIAEVPELQKCVETGEINTASAFAETLAKSLKSVQNEFIKKIENKTSEWESRRNSDLELIETLQVKIQTLSEKSNELEVEISKMSLEKEELGKSHSNLLAQLAQAETVISANNEEIRDLRYHEVTLKQTKNELTSANETILTLQSRMTSITSEKEESETRCRVLEGTIEDLRREDLRPALEAVKATLENVQRENEKLREMNEQSETVIEHLKSESRQRNAEEMLREIENLKELEKSRLSALLEILEDGKNRLREMAELPNPTENSAFGTICEKLRETVGDSHILSAFESAADFMRVEFDMERNSYASQVENLKDQIKALAEKSSEYEMRLSEAADENAGFNKLYEDLKNRLRETEARLSLREEEISILKKQEDVLKDMKDTIALADETISKLNGQLSLMEEEKKEVESQCRELEETVTRLKNELEKKEMLLLELDNAKSTAVDTRNENEELKQLIEKSEEIMDQLKTESLQREQELLREIECLKNREASRFSVLFEVLEDFKKSTTDGSESSLTFVPDKLRERAGDSQLLSAAEAILKCAQIDFETRRKSDLSAMLNFQNQIETANERNAQFENRLSEVLSENGEVKKLCEDLKKQLEEAGGIICSRDEEVTRLKKEEEVLTKLKEDLDLLEDVEDGEYLADRIEKLIMGMLELQKNAETQMASVFAETLAKSFKGVRNEFIEKMESKRSEWESRRNVDLDLIETLQVKIKTLSEKSYELEVEISKISLERENLKNQMAEAQTTISTNSELIRALRSHEDTLKQTKDELAIANETILTLKSQVTSAESEKDERELRCRKLEENIASLQAEIETKETIIRGLYELKEKMENQSDDLKRQITQSEDAIRHLKRELESAAEEESAKESRIRDLLSEIDSLKKDKESLMDLSERMEKLESTNRNLMDIFSDVRSHLDLPEDTMTKLLSGNLENKKIFSEKMNSLVRAQTEELKAENKTLKLSNENLKEKVKQLTRLLCESANADIKEESALNLNAPQSTAMTLRSKAGKNVELFVRQLDKLEDLNHNLTELLTEVLTLMDFPGLEKLRLSASARNFPALSKRVMRHVKGFLSKLTEMREENATLDEECETYSNIIKDLKKEATAVWRANEEKTEAMLSDLSRMREEKVALEKEREELLAKISRLEGEWQRLKPEARDEGPLHNCNCINESKKINDLKRAILIKEQKLLELQDLESQTSSYKSQIEYLKNALEREKKKVAEEKDKNKKLQTELNEATKNHHKTESKREDQNEILDELRLRGSLSGGGVVQEFVDKEKMRKLSKDIGILKELCRARYVEIKRLEAVNASLRNKMPKNSNQMDSPIRTRGPATSSKNAIVDTWKTERTGKENSPMVRTQRLH